MSCTKQLFDFYVLCVCIYLLLLQVLQIACGGMHTVALLEDGRIFSWGVNDEGALGRETGTPAPPCQTGNRKPAPPCQTGNCD